METNFEFSEVLPNSFEYFDDRFPSEKYSNVDYGAVAQGVGALGESIGGAVGKSAEKKTAQEMGKTPIQREVDTRCGKDKSKSWSKKKKSEYLACKQSVITNFDAQKQKESSSKDSQKQIAMKVAQAKEKQKNMLFIGIGVLLVVGVIIYFKNKTKQV